MITICIPTLNRYDRLFECVKSAFDTSSIVSKVMIIDNGLSLDQEEFINRFDDHLKRKFEFHIFGKNIGVAASWNFFLENALSPAVICNDDIVFGEKALANIWTSYINNPLSIMFYAIRGINMFSCFLPTYKLIDTIGKFDENFYPAYFEDNDYAYRIKLAGLLDNLKPVDADIKHYGSSTIASYTSDEMRAHHLKFNENRTYYINKWGGPPGEERYRIPFNGAK